MQTRLGDLEGKIAECGHSRLEFGALISELAALNSSVKALTEAMLLNLKHSQAQQKSKLDGDKASVANASIGKIVQPLAPPSLAEAEGAECTRYYTRVHSGSRGKEVARGPTPPRLVLNAEGPQSRSVPPPSKNVDVAPADEGAGASTSPGSDCALISPPAKASKPATASRRKATSNTRGKALAKERAVDANNNDLAATGTTPTVPASKKVSNNNIFFANMEWAGGMKWVASINSGNIIIAFMQITDPNMVSAACRQVRVPRMSVAGVGAALFLKVRADLNLSLLNYCNGFCSIASNMMLVLRCGHTECRRRRGKGNKTSTRQPNPNWDLERNRTKIPAKNTPYVRIATPTGYINLELCPGALLM